MLDIGLVEIGVVGLVALLVLGPERLPEVARVAGKWLARWRRLWTSVQQDFDDNEHKSEQEK